MRGLIDATCSSCGGPMQWDTICPRLCTNCYERQTQTVKQGIITPEEPVEAAAEQREAA